MVRGGRCGRDCHGRGGVTPTANVAHQSTPARESHASASTPQRRCIVTGETRERRALLRFVVAPDGAIVPDVETRLPGRGLWLTPRRDIIERAVAKRVFARAARRPVSVPPEFAERIESLLARRCGDLIGLARRAGLAVAGADRVGEVVRRGKAALLLFAFDGAEASRRKLADLGCETPVAGVLSAAELGAAFGRERIVHVAIGSGPLAQQLLDELARLAGMRRGAAIEYGADDLPARPAAL